MTRLRLTGVGLVLLMVLAVAPESVAGTSGVAYEFDVDGDREARALEYVPSRVHVAV